MGQHPKPGAPEGEDLGQRQVGVTREVTSQRRVPTTRSFPTQDLSPGLETEPVWGGLGHQDRPLVLTAQSGSYRGRSSPWWPRAGQKRVNSGILPNREFANSAEGKYCEDRVHFLFELTDDSSNED